MPDKDKLIDEFIKEWPCEFETHTRTYRAALVKLVEDVSLAENRALIR